MALHVRGGVVREAKVAAGGVSTVPWKLTAVERRLVGQRPCRRLVLVGATDLAATLATLAEPLRRKVVVLDPRTTHVRSGAFPSTAEIVRAWPDEWMTRRRLRPSDAVVMLSHDPRIDDRGIRAALACGAGHVAALRSRATHRQRLRRLDGLPGLHRLAAPAGLNLGGASLADTALSILAGMVAAENGRSGGLLRDGDLSIRAVAV